MFMPYLRFPLCADGDCVRRGEGNVRAWYWARMHAHGI